MLLSRPLDDSDAVGSRNDGDLRKPDEQAVLDHARDGGERAGERRRLRDARERGIEQQVPAIRDESMALAGLARLRRARTAAFGGGRLDGAPRRDGAERDDLDRQREAA